LYVSISILVYRSLGHRICQYGNSPFEKDIGKQIKMSEVLGGLAINGKLIMIGVSDEPLEVSPIFFLSGRRSVAGWPAGTSIDSQETLSFSVLSGVRPMNEIYPLEQATEAYEQMMSGKARFRAVLTTGR
jgi:D-arabinose 1-dehydrogenase-like Zn-dependent alcohol dehydrogenase